MLISLLAAPALATPGPPPAPRVMWPDRYAQGVPRDLVIQVLVEPGSSGEPVSLTTAAGDPVSYTTYPWTTLQGETWWMLQPDAELAPGAYTVSSGSYDTTDFVVEDRLAAVAGPPGPYRRWRRTGCEDGDALSYRMCGGGIVHLVATGGDPGEPALDAPGTALVGTVLEESFDLPVGDGWPSEVWVGDLDEAGRFTGWWGPDAVEPAAPGVHLSEAPAGSSASPGVTSDTIYACPAEAPWETYEDRECSPTDLVTRSAGCGCGTAPPDPRWGGVLLLVAVGRRSGRARSARTGEAVSRSSAGPSGRSSRRRG